MPPGKSPGSQFWVPWASFACPCLLTKNTEHNLTSHPARDSSGKLTPDGKTLVFLSNRDNGTNHLFAVSLTRITEDPNDPLVKQRESQEQPSTSRREGRRGGRRGEDAEPAEEEEEEQDPQPETPLEIQLDLDGIDLRPVQLTSGSSGVSTFFLSEDGETVYFVSGAGAGGGRGRRGRGGGGDTDNTSALFSIGVDGENRKQVAEGSFSGLQLSADGEYLFFRERSGGGSGRAV